MRNSTDQRSILQALTVFSMLCVLNVLDAVTVWVCVGGGKKVVAIGTELVGYKLLADLAVIFVPGLPCIGAYLTPPVCAVYAATEPEEADAAPFPPATLFCVGGPFVSVIAFAASAIAGGKVPVIPLKENRSE